MGDKNDGKVIISHQIWHLYFNVPMMKVLHSICILTWRENKYVSHQKKAQIEETKEPKNNKSCPDAFTQQLYFRKRHNSFLPNYY